VARKLTGLKRKLILFPTSRIGILQNITRISSREVGIVFMREHLQFFKLQTVFQEIHGSGMSVDLFARS
jgi:hypothetical protein